MRTPPNFDELSTNKHLMLERVKELRSVSVTDNEGQDGSNFRVCRLNRVLGFLMGRFNCSFEQLVTKYGLLAIHDHKGNLTSVWLTPAHFAAGIKQVNSAWDAECESQHEAIIFDHHTSDSQTVRVS